jgi:hypothetical protein
VRGGCIAARVGADSGAMHVTRGTDLLLRCTHARGAAVRTSVRVCALERAGVEHTRRRAEHVQQVHAACMSRVSPFTQGSAPGAHRACASAGTQTRRRLWLKQSGVGARCNQEAAPAAAASVC